MQAREILECFKWSLMNGSGGSSEDQNADRNVYNKGCLAEVHREMRTLLRIGLEVMHVAF
jgi:hypothetical protein